MVYFIGAGPGAVDLITVRGLAILKKADVVIYAGSLVNPELLAYTKPDCQIFNSAKMTLEEIIEILAIEETENKILVRLHTGDPSIYGAIKEQIDLLAKKNIKSTVIPGVSSFCGAAAALNAEFTLPNISQTVILTRMEGRTPVPADEDIAKLAKHKASMVIFLSTSMLDKLSKKLIEGGLSEETPAAIVYKATWPEQKVIRTNICELKQKALENNITKTALILVGDFLDGDYEQSKLYDKNFTHEFRQAKQQ